MYNNEIATVVSAKNYLLELRGLPSAKINNLISGENGARAIVTGLEDERIKAALLTEDSPTPGTKFSLDKQGVPLPASPERLLGRVLTPLGEPLDDRPDLSTVDSSDLKKAELEVAAGGIGTRELIRDQLQTGVAVVDTLLPLGKGQRELIYGEPRVGKSTFLLDTIIHQKETDIVCVYALLGRSEEELNKVISRLRSANATEYTLIFAATSRRTPPLIALAPKIAFAAADRLRSTGRDVLLILDDLGTHAKYLRETALLSGRTPGRESYPGDIFYQHAHLMERAGSYNEKEGGGSITLLPVIEGSPESMTDLIPTNLMSSTDGHLLFSASLRAQGVYPAIDIAGSVTRVGHQTQPILFKQLAYKLRSLLAEHSELKKYEQFGRELTEQTQEKLKRGRIVQLLLHQEPGEYLEPFVQLALLSLPFTKLLGDIELETLRQHKSGLQEKFRENDEKLLPRPLVEYDKLEEFISDLESTAKPIVEEILN